MHVARAPRARFGELVEDDLDADAHVLACSSTSAKSASLRLGASSSVRPAAADLGEVAQDLLDGFAGAALSRRAARSTDIGRASGRARQEPWHHAASACTCSSSGASSSGSSGSNASSASSSARQDVELEHGAAGCSIERTSRLASTGLRERRRRANARRPQGPPAHSAPQMPPCSSAVAMTAPACVNDSRKRVVAEFADGAPEVTACNVLRGERSCQMLSPPRALLTLAGAAALYSRA